MDPMEHRSLVEGFKRGEVTVHADRERAFRIMQNASRFPMIPAARRNAHRFWAFAALTLFWGSPLVWWFSAWYWGLASLAASLVVFRAVKQSDAGFVMETALEDAGFCGAVVDMGIVRFERKPGIGTTPEKEAADA